MAHKMINTLVLFTTLVSAAAFPRISRSLTACPPTEFSLQMKVGDTWQSVNALGNCTAETLNLVAEPLSGFKGTPVALMGNATNAQLMFNLNGYNSSLTDATGLWTLFVGDIGAVYGSYLSVIAERNITYTGFSVSNGSVYNQLTDADQTWVACNTTIGGTSYTTLGWGLQFSNGSWPTGCEPTLVKQNWNYNCSSSHAASRR